MLGLHDRTQASLVVVHRLRRRAACAVLIPRLGIEPVTRVPCIGRRIPNHWTTGKVPLAKRYLHLLSLPPEKFFLHSSHNLFLCSL